MISFRRPWLLVGLLTLAACRQTQPIASAIPMGPFQTFVAPIPAALLPFQNVTTNPDAGERITSFFEQNLLTSGLVDLVPDGEVRAALARHGIRWTNRIDPIAGRKLADDLGVNHLILGSVTMYTESPEPSVSCNMIILNIRSGETDFSASQTLSAKDREGPFQLGRPPTVAALANIVAGEIVESLWKIALPGANGPEDPMERRRFMARSSAAIAEIRHKAQLRRQDELREIEARLRTELAEVSARADSTFQALAVATVRQEERLENEARLKAELAVVAARADSASRALAIATARLEELNSRTKPSSPLLDELLRSLNEADIEELVQVFGISTSDAEAILNYRRIIGPIDAFEIIELIPKISPAGRASIRHTVMETARAASTTH